MKAKNIKVGNKINGLTVERIRNSLGSVIVYYKGFPRPAVFDANADIKNVK